MLIDTNTYLGHWAFRPLPWRDADSLLRAMDAHGIDQAFVSSASAILYRNPQAGNEELFAETRAHPDRLIPFAVINPTYADWEHDLAVCCEEFGIRGLRLYPKYHRYSLGDANGNALIEAATARGDLQVIILRAGDFYGPGSSADWFDQAILSARGKVQSLGTPGVGHSWAYLPDLARAFEAVASRRSTLGPIERLHFAGHFVTGEEMATAILRTAPVKLRAARFPLWLLPLLGLVNPLMREIGKMAYLWRNSMELRDGRLDELLGPGFGTPFESAVAATVAPFFAGETARAMEPATALRG